MNAIGFREIKAWSDLRGIDLLDWELDAILALDLKRRSVACTKTDDKPKQEVSSRKLTSKLFDALFPGRK